MALNDRAARNFIIQVEAAAPNTWLDIAGINSHKLNPSEGEEEADRTKYSSAGRSEHWIMERGATIELEGTAQFDETTGAQDPGQARVETLGDAVGSTSLGRIRFRHPLDTVWKIWSCSASLGEKGGGNNDLDAWAVTFKRSGASTTAAVS